MVTLENKAVKGKIMENTVKSCNDFKSFLIMAFICIFGFATLGQSQPQEGALPDETSQEETEAVSTLTALESKMQKTVSIDVSEVPIEMVIRQLAEQVDVDFIVSPQVEGNVTVTLNNVSVKEALESILDVHGCGFIQGENIIRVFSREEMPDVSERLVTQTFEIIYADVVEVVAALDKFKSAKGSVSSIQGTSHIIVTDEESKVRDIARLIEKIDRITPQVLIEVRIYDITSKNNLDLGVDWWAGRRTNWSASGYPLNDSIVVERNGIDTYISSHTEPSFMTGFSAGTNKTADSTMGYLRFGVLDENIDVDAQIRAEQENIDAKLLANPRIMVIDNETALFDIVTEHPYVERTITGATVTETVKFKNVGTKLQVTPHITRDGMVRMRILPEFGIIVGQVQVATSNVPIVDTRKVDTTALVQDGQSVVLGGLKKKDTSKQINKVPLLGDLPILGNLFRFEGEATTVAELVVFITPKIIPAEPFLTEREQQALAETEFEGPEPSKTKAELSSLGE